MQSNLFEYHLADTKDQIPPSSVVEFKICTSIHTSYPVGELLLADPEGRVLSELMIRPGTILQIVAISNDSETLGSPYALTPMVIVGVENAENENDLKLTMLDSKMTPRTGALGGHVRIHLAHPWGVFTDWRNKAFTKKSISKIVTSIVEEDSRGFKFERVSIGATDDTTNGPNRYKLQESESSFIARKLLPYATIDGSAVYSFVNEKHEFFFQNFKFMYDQDPAISLIPASQEVMSEGSQIDLKELVDIHHISEGRWFIGNQFKDQLGVLRKFMYVDDSEARVAYRALTQYKSAIPGYTLLKQGFVTSSIALASEAYQFRHPTDSMRLAINRDGIMNEFFEISITTTACFDIAAVGYPAELRLVEARPNQKHWADGKWLVTQSEHGVSSGQTYSKLRLSRPAITNLPNDLNPVEFFKVE
jgi:hypothetical protein